MTAGSIAVPTVMPLRYPVAQKSKNSIDSNTLIEIRSETPGTKIYYTVDNTRPDPDKKLGEHTTMVYKEPFMLRAGKRYIKAMAMTKDGRESNVVTKVFTVEYAEPLTPTDSDSDGVDNSINFQRQLRNDSKMSTRMVTASVMSGRGPVKGVQGWAPDSSPSPRGRLLSLSRLQTPNHQSRDGSPKPREDLIRCVHCDTVRPRKNAGRFCPECGKPVPVDPNSDSVEPGSMGMCLKCRSYIPLSQSKCIVCEEPIASRPRQITSVRLPDGIVCGACGSNNPPHLTHCASCEHRFPAQVHVGENAPPLPRLDSALVRCPSCTRVNNPDARFCDWCGEKPIPEELPLTCSLCKQNNSPYAKFCGACGSKFQAPERMDPRNSQLGDRATNYPFDSLPMWKSIPLPTLPRSPSPTRVVRAARRPTREQHSQTVGMFYPGGKKLVQEQEMLQEMRNMELRMRDKHPPLSAISPGRGFWRKQLDHICGHLRGYTTNNVEFRSVLGEPRLGKILGTTIDEGDEEMVLSVTFALRSHDEFGDGGNRLQRDLYQNKKKVAFGSTMLEDETEEKQTKKAKKKRKKSATQLREEKMNPEDRLLHKELGPRGEGRSVEVKQLISEGADPNCLDAERRTPLHVAISNDRRSCLRPLLQGGADANRRSGAQHNSPLHLAVKLGPEGKDVVKMLLDYGARHDVKNERGLSPYDVAVRSDYNSIVAMFNEPTGEKQKKKARKRDAGKKKKGESSSEDSDDTDDLF